MSSHEQISGWRYVMQRANEAFAKGGNVMFSIVCTDTIVEYAYINGERVVLPKDIP